MRPPSQVYYAIDRVRMVRLVAPHDGQAYVHTLTRQVYEAVADIVAVEPGPFDVKSVADRHRLPFTQVHVALDFLTERGLMAVEGRRRYVVDGYVPAFVEHAVTEWLALEHHCNVAPLPEAGFSTPPAEVNRG
jgi:hypothetical protein